MVEMIIVAPVLLLLAFGVIEFGRAYDQKIDLNETVRDGARAGSRAEFPVGCTDSTNGSFAANVICTAASSGDDTGVTWKVVAGGAEGDDLRVCASRPIAAVTPIMSELLDGRTLRSSVTMRIEKIDDTMPPGNGSSGGADMSWCS